MLTNADALDRYFEFSKKWVAHIEDSRGCSGDTLATRTTATSTIGHTHAPPPLPPSTIGVSAAEQRAMVYKLWSRDRYAALVVDIVRSPPRSPRGTAADGSQTPQGHHNAAYMAIDTGSPSTDSPASATTSGQLLERWTIQCVTEHPSDYVTIPAVLERRLSVLTRTLYSVTRLMPLFNCGKRAKLGLSSYVYVETSPPPDASYSSIPSASREFYALPRISLAWGAISIVVEYMNNNALVQYLSSDAARTAALYSPMPSPAAPSPVHQQYQQQQMQVQQGGGDGGSRGRPGGAAQASPVGSHPNTKYLKTPDAPQPQQGSPHLAHWGPGDYLHQQHQQQGGVGVAAQGRAPYHGPTGAVDHNSYGAGAGGPPISRSLDSKGNVTLGMYMASNINAAYFKTPPVSRQGNAAPSPSAQFIEPGSSFNSSSSGRSGLHAEFLEGAPGQLSSSHGYTGGALAYSHQSVGTIPQFVGIGGHLGSSPTQIMGGPGSLGSDIVGSSPLTGAGATFQYARQRGGSFDYRVDQQLQQQQPFANTAALIRFYNLPPSPFDPTPAEKARDVDETGSNRNSFASDGPKSEGVTGGLSSAALRTAPMGIRGASPLAPGAEEDGDRDSLSISSGDDTDSIGDGDERESRGHQGAAAEEDLPFELEGESARPPSSRPSEVPDARRRSRGRLSTKLAALNRSTVAKGAPATQGAAYQLQQLFQDAPKLASSYNYGQTIEKLAVLLAESCEIPEGL